MTMAAEVAHAYIEPDIGNLLRELDTQISHQQERIYVTAKRLASNKDSKAKRAEIYGQARSVLSDTIYDLMKTLEANSSWTDINVANEDIAELKGRVQRAAETMLHLSKADISVSQKTTGSKTELSRCSRVLRNVDSSIFLLAEPESEEPDLTVFLTLDSSNPEYLKLSLDSELDVNDLGPYVQKTVSSVFHVLNELLHLRLSSVEDGDDGSVLIKFGQVSTIETLVDVIQTFVISLSELVSPYPSIANTVLNECSRSFIRGLCEDCIPRLYPKSLEEYPESKRSIEGLRGLEEVLTHFRWTDTLALSNLVNAFPSTWKLYACSSDRLSDLRNLFRDTSYKEHHLRNPQPKTAGTVVPGPVDTAETHVDGTLAISHPPTSIPESDPVPSEPGYAASEKLDDDLLDDEVEDGWGWGDSNGEDGFLTDVESLHQNEPESVAVDEPHIADPELTTTEKEYTQPGETVTKPKSDVLEHGKAIVEMEEEEAEVEPHSSLRSIQAIFRSAESANEPLDAYCTLYQVLAPVHYRTAFPLALYTDTKILAEGLHDPSAQAVLIQFADARLSEAMLIIQEEQERLAQLLTPTENDQDMAEIVKTLKHQILQVCKNMRHDDDNTFPILQLLTEEACRYIISAVMQRDDISEQTSLELHSCISLLNELERLFESISEAVPSWIKLQRLALLLTASLEDIRQMIQSSYLLDFSGAELSHIVQALFIESTKRTEILNLLR